MVLGLIVIETPDFLGHIFRQKTQPGTIFMVSWPGIFFNGNVLCTHILLSFIVLISFSASGTLSSSETRFSVTFNSATAPQMRIFLSFPSTLSVDICNPLFLYTLLTFTTLWISVMVFASVIIYAFINCMCLEIVIKIWYFS